MKTFLILAMVIAVTQSTLLKNDKIELNEENIQKYLKIFDDMEKVLLLKYQRIENLKNFMRDEDEKIKSVPYNTSVIKSLKKKLFLKLAKDNVDDISYPIECSVLNDKELRPFYNKTFTKRRIDIQDELNRFYRYTMDPLKTGFENSRENFVENYLLKYSKSKTDADKEYYIYHLIYEINELSQEVEDVEAEIASKERELESFVKMYDLQKKYFDRRLDECKEFLESNK